MARVLHKGILQEVVVDDYFPVSRIDGHPMGANPSGENEIWVMILEKCWAKLYGSYDAIDGKSFMIQVGCQMKSFMLFPELQSSSILQMIALRLNSKISLIRWWSVVIWVMSYAAGLMNSLKYETWALF